jgi:hypothetical protein
MRTANVRELFKLVLAILVSAGLTIAPLATPATAGHSMAGRMMQMADMPDMTSEMPASEMPASEMLASEMPASDMQASDMPCCPDQQKNKGCQDCPLVAICMLSALPAKPSTDAIVIRLASHRPLRAFDDMIVDGLVRPPPDRPPRLLV